VKTPARFPQVSTAPGLRRARFCVTVRADQPPTTKTLGSMRLHLALSDRTQILHSFVLDHALSEKPHVDTKFDMTKHPTLGASTRWYLSLAPPGALKATWRRSLRSGRLAVLSPAVDLSKSQIWKCRRCQPKHGDRISTQSFFISQPKTIFWMHLYYYRRTGRRFFGHFPSKPQNPDLRNVPYHAFRSTEFCTFFRTLYGRSVYTI